MPFFLLPAVLQPLLVLCTLYTVQRHDNCRKAQRNCLFASITTSIWMKTNICNKWLEYFRQINYDPSISLTILVYVFFSPHRLSFPSLQINELRFFFSRHKKSLFALRERNEIGGIVMEKCTIAMQWHNESVYILSPPLALVPLLTMFYHNISILLRWNFCCFSSTFLYLV